MTDQPHDDGPEFVRVAPHLLEVDKEGVIRVRRVKLDSLRAGNRAVEAHLMVREELKRQILGLQQANDRLGNAVKVMADDRARVEAWEAQYALKDDDPVRWLVRIQQREVEGKPVIAYVVALGVPEEGEQGCLRWRDAMTAAIVLTEEHAPKPEPAAELHTPAEIPAPPAKLALVP